MRPLPSFSWPMLAAGWPEPLGERVAECACACGCAAPEEAVLKALKKIKGITEVETQTYTLMPL